MRRTPASTLLERAGSTAAGLGSLGTGQPRLRRWFKWGLVALVAGFLAVFVAVQWRRLPDYDWQFRPSWLFLSAVGVGMFYAVQAEAWFRLLRALGEDMDARQARAIWGRSMIARYVPTSVLMVVGRVVMVEKHGVTKRGCLASIVYELGLQFATAVIVGAYFVITLPQLSHNPARYGVLAVIPLVIVMFHPRIFRGLANFALRKLGRSTLPAVLPLRRVLAFAAIYVIGWLAIGVGVVGFAAAVHPMDVKDIGFAAAAYPVAFCVAVLTFVVPGGLGTRDAALAVSIAAVLPTAVAAAIAIGFRIFQTVIELIYVGVVSAVARNASRRSRTFAEEPELEGAPG